MNDSTVYIAVGSNLGDREANCKLAIKLLVGIGDVKKTSPLYDTPPWGVKDQPRFLNGAVELSTTLSPLELLKGLKSIEKKIGRTQSAERYGPRVIDLDIIFFGREVIDTQGLTIPHPRMHERAFVLVPLNDVAPGVVHPELKKTVRELLAALPSSDIESLSLQEP